jgi:hypothetical protein
MKTGIHLRFLFRTNPFSSRIDHCPFDAVRGTEQAKSSAECSWTSSHSPYKVVAGQENEPADAIHYHRERGVPQERTTDFAPRHGWRPVLRGDDDVRAPDDDVAGHSTRPALNSLKGGGK